MRNLVRNYEESPHKHSKVCHPARSRMEPILVTNDIYWYSVVTWVSRIIYYTIINYFDNKYRKYLFHRVSYIKTWEHRFATLLLADLLKYQIDVNLSLIFLFSNLDYICLCLTLYVLCICVPRACIYAIKYFTQGCNNINHGKIAKDVIIGISETVLFWK